MSTTPQYNLNPDGSYMNAEQIVDDILTHRLSTEAREALVKPRPDNTPKSGLAIPTEADYAAHAWIWTRQSFGRWIRNSYGLWAEDNPIRALWDSERAQHVINGCDHSPHHPDNYSGRVMDLVIERLKSEAA